MKKFWISGILFFSVGFVLCGRAPAGFGAEGLQPLEQSQAYQDFLKKPENNLSKAICLLNYFRTAPVMVQYEGIDYTPQFAYPFGLVYLMANYRGDDPVKWAKKNCYRSFLANEIIYFKFQDGSSRPARDVIIEKVHELEATQRERAPKS